MVFAKIKIKTQIVTPITPYNFQWGCVGLPPPKNQAEICAALKNKAPMTKRVIKINAVMFN